MRGHDADGMIIQRIDLHTMDSESGVSLGIITSVVRDTTSDLAKSKFVYWFFQRFRSSNSNAY